MWIVTSEVNDYDQHGAYFIAAYSEMPTFRQLKDLLTLDDVTTGKLTRGGGRQGYEDVWFNLIEVRDGVRYPIPDATALMQQEEAI